jgi:deoxyuridine 5'-triphosphate nucleotidohydrolase
MLRIFEPRDRVVKLKYRILSDGGGNHGFSPLIMTKGAACADLSLPTSLDIAAGMWNTVPLLIAFDIPEEFCLYLQPRSSTFSIHGVLSTTGIIDADYHGGVHAQLYNMNTRAVHFDQGTRLVQIQLLPRYHMDFEEVQYLSMTNRSNHMGSTGR